jgi:hypothetical protein
LRSFFTGSREPFEYTTDSAKPYGLFLKRPEPLLTNQPSFFLDTIHPLIRIPKLQCFFTESGTGLLGFYNQPVSNLVKRIQWSDLGLDQNIVGYFENTSFPRNYL